MNEALVANYNESAQWKVQVQRISLYIYAILIRHPYLSFCTCGCGHL
jgi:hypothetical protein